MTRSLQTLDEVNHQVERIGAQFRAEVEVQQALTFIIEGFGPWEKRATPEEAGRMSSYVRAIETRDCQDRCETCAFRSGTPANGSSLIVRVVDMCLANGSTFMCHTTPEEPVRVCAGFDVLRDVLSHANLLEVVRRMSFLVGAFNRMKFNTANAARALRAMRRVLRRHRPHKKHRMRARRRAGEFT